MALYMETTRIDAGRTVAEIHTLLGSLQWVNAIQTAYTNGKPVGVAFIAEVEGRQVPFQLPARSEPVFHYLQRKRPALRREKCAALDREQAERVAWRHILRWIQAQVAIIEVGMVSVSEVFLPYAMLPNRQTMHERWTEAVRTNQLAGGFEPPADPEPRTPTTEPRTPEGACPDDH